MSAATVVVPRTRVAGAAVLGAAAAVAVAPVHIGVPCPFLAITGRPCPLCGMTRAVTAAVRGDVVASLRFNVFGVLLIAGAIALVVLPSRWRRAITAPAWSWLALLAVMWAYNLLLNPTF